MHLFSKLFIIPYSILFDIHYFFSSWSSNFSCIDVAILSTLYLRFVILAQCSLKIDRRMFTVETMVPQTELLFLSYEQT